ncbi:MAG: hypothetical protein RI963_1827 [Planctomycetota bacterium]|jgi:hypothetical protein
MTPIGEENIFAANDDLTTRVNASREIASKGTRT